MAKAKPSQYTFELRDVLIALLKEQGIHEGFWMLAFEFTTTIGTMGAQDSPPRPAVLSVVSKMNIVHHESAPPVELDICVDAAKVNPRQKNAERPARKKKRTSRASTG